MSTVPVSVPRSPYSKMLRHVLVFLAAQVLARLVLEVAEAPANITRLLSSTGTVILAAIYLAAVGPLKGGLQKLSQLPLPAILLAAWTGGWIIVATIVAGVFRQLGDRSMCRVKMRSSGCKANETFAHGQP